MIDFRFKKILLVQAFSLALLSIGLFWFFKKALGIHSPASFTHSYILIWIIFIFFNLIFLVRYALPSKKLLDSLKKPIDPMETGWLEIENTLEQKEEEVKIIKDEFEKENLTFKTLLDSLKDPVFIFDEKEIVFYCNSAFTEFFKIGDYPKNSPLIELVRHFEFQEFIKNSIKDNSPTKVNNFSFDHIQELNRRYFDISIFPMNTHQKFLCVFYNVTERKMAEIVREDFVANFSHEIRTPLTIIHGQSQILESELDLSEKSTISSALKKIESNTKRLLNLFNDLLTLTQVEKQRSLNKEVVEIEILFTSIFEELKSHYKKNAKIDFELESTTVFSDYHLLEQIVINLLDNAFKYSQNESVSLLIKCQRNLNYDVLTIKDNGIGISQEHLPRIFERFFRSNLARTGSIPGTGLGLSIVKHIMLNHGGKVKVDSVLEKGTMFELHFPIQ